MGWIHGLESSGYCGWVVRPQVGAFSWDPLDSINDNIAPLFVNTTSVTCWQNPFCERRGPRSRS